MRAMVVTLLYVVEFYLLGRIFGHFWCEFEELMTQICIYICNLTFFFIFIAHILPLIIV